MAAFSSDDEIPAEKYDAAYYN